MSKRCRSISGSRVLAAIAGRFFVPESGAFWGERVKPAPWRALERAQGDAKPKALGGDRGWGRVETPRQAESRACREGLGVGIATPLTLLRAAITLKKDGTHGRAEPAHGLELRARPDVLNQRKAWVEGHST
jgi:hypothetical protein